MVGRVFAKGLGSDEMADCVQLMIDGLMAAFIISKLTLRAPEDVHRNNNIGINLVHTRPVEVNTGEVQIIGSKK